MCVQMCVNLIPVVYFNLKAGLREADQISQYIKAFD